MIKQVLLLNGLAAAMIPLHHASAYGLRVMFFWTSRCRPEDLESCSTLDVLSAQVLLIVRQFDAFAVPAFLFVSGFYIALAGAGSGSSALWSTILARVKFLAIPFVVWTTIYFVVIERLPRSIDDILAPYYYVPVIIQLYLISPLLLRVLTQSKWVVLCLAVLAEIFVESPRYLSYLGVRNDILDALVWFTPQWFFVGHVLWFVLGAVISLSRTAFTRKVTRWRNWLVMLLVLSTVLVFAEYRATMYLSGQVWLGPTFRGISHILYTVLIIVTWLSLYDVRLPAEKLVAALASRSFGIYLVNQLPIYVAASVIYKRVWWILEFQPLYQFILIVAGLGVPLLLMEVVRRSFMRPTYRFVFG
jgi:hypothetical protein